MRHVPPSVAFHVPSITLCPSAKPHALSRTTCTLPRVPFSSDRSLSLSGDIVPLYGVSCSLKCSLSSAWLLAHSCTVHHAPFTAPVCAMLPRLLLVFAPDFMLSRAPCTPPWGTMSPQLLSVPPQSSVLSRATCTPTRVPCSLGRSLSLHRAPCSLVHHAACTMHNAPCAMHHPFAVPCSLDCLISLCGAPCSSRCHAPLRGALCSLDSSLSLRGALCPPMHHASCTTYHHRGMLHALSTTPCPSVRLHYLSCIMHQEQRTMPAHGDVLFVDPRPLAGLYALLDDICPSVGCHVPSIASCSSTGLHALSGTVLPFVGCHIPLIGFCPSAELRLSRTQCGPLRGLFYLLRAPCPCLGLYDLLLSIASYPSTRFLSFSRAPRVPPCGAMFPPQGSITSSAPYIPGTMFPRSLLVPPRGSKLSRVPRTPL